MALLNLFSKESILKFIAFFLHGIGPSLWSKAKATVADAEAKFPAAGSGEDKKAFAKAMLSDFAKSASNLALNWLIETAVSFALSKVKA